MFSLSKNVLYRSGPIAARNDSANELVINRMKELNLYVYQNKLIRRGIVLNPETRYKILGISNEFSTNFESYIDQQSLKNITGNRKRKF